MSWHPAIVRRCPTPTSLSTPELHVKLFNGQDLFTPTREKGLSLPPALQRGIEFR
jgi:hypothetical protein